MGTYSTRHKHSEYILEMTYQFDRNKQQLTIHGQAFSSRDFEGEKPQAFFSSPELADLYVFLHEWFNDEDFVWVKTSGSTGTPKPFKAEKERMMQSAKLTCSYLGLKQGNSALLCMKLGYIAGKMVVVRALIAGLQLTIVPVTGNPLARVDQPIDFAAMIPLQVFNSLRNPVEKEKLSAIRHLIIGGGSIDSTLVHALQEFPNAVYSTYGMTETLSHIALRRLNGKDAADFYTAMGDVKISVSSDETLIIEAPKVSEKVLQTNDVVELVGSNQFRVIGRIDNIINSGGIKIQIEDVETQLRPFLSDDFAISALPDPKFGEIVVLVVTKPIETSVLERLSSYQRPKKVILIEKIPLTETGKIERKKLKEIIRKKEENVI